MSEIEWYEQQLVKARQEGNRHMMGVYLGSLGNMYATQGDIYQGIAYLEEAKRIREGLQEWDDVALTCKNLAGCYEIGLHDLATAAKYMEIAAIVASADNPDKATYQAMLRGMRRRMEEAGK